MAGFITANIQQVLFFACIWWALALLWVMRYPGSANLWGTRLIRAIMGVLVLLPSWLALVYLRGIDNGVLWVLYLAAIVCAADIGAYFVGKAFGKSKLMPQVSPGKSWAGFWGGVASTSLLALIVGWAATNEQLSVFALIAVSVVAGLASVLGDLLESMLKRHRGVKDSSHLLPGHGGVLDRLDSLTAAAPVFALLMILLV